MSMFDGLKLDARLKSYLVIILGALLPLTSALINGLSIVYSDTSAYIVSGFELETPFDRPITYGLFLWLSSLGGSSLWLVIFFQALILSFLVFNLLKLCLPHHKSIHQVHILTLGVLSAVSTMAWTTSQLIADIFTSTAILSLFLVITGNYHKWKQGFLYFTFLLSTAMHMSHITLSIILIELIFIFKYLNLLGLKKSIKVVHLSLCLGLTFLCIFSMGSALEKSRHGFLMGALVEHGIAKEYLDDYCPTKDYQFCSYKDSLPDKAWKFLWNEDSPFYKMGGWKTTKAEFNEIICGTLTDPKFIGLHIKESIKATADQLLKFKVGDGNGAFKEGTLLHERIAKYFPHELSSYESSLQSKNQLMFIGWYNKLIYLFIYISIMGLVYVLIKSHLLDSEVLTLIIIALSGIIINAWVCGTLANAIDRLGSKVMWLIPLVTIIGIINLKSDRKVVENS